jgi:hypothetical protein
MFLRVDLWWTVAIATLQQRVGACEGTVGEVGVHYGDYFIILARMASDHETLWACDVFDDQQYNTDHSGKGNESVFRNNVMRFAARSVENVVRKSSYFLLRDGYLPPTPFRLLSIDGSHTQVATFNDLVWGATCLAEGGILILDDVLHPTWPGVTRGLRAYWHVHDRKYKYLAPIFLGVKKLWLTSRTWHSNYSVALRYAAKHAQNKTHRAFLVGFSRFAKILTLYEENKSRATAGDVPLYLPSPGTQLMPVWISRQLQIPKGF